MKANSPPVTAEEVRAKYSEVKSTLRERGPQPLHNLDVFLEENTYLFTLLSVFIALAVYFSQFQELPLEESDRVGLVGGVFVLILIIAIVTLYKILSFTTRDGREIAQYENLGVLAFGMSLVPLFSIIFDVFWTYTEPTSGILSGLAVITGSVGAWGYILGLGDLADRLEEKTRFNENLIFLTLLFIGLFILSSITQTDFYLPNVQAVEPTSGVTSWISLAITTGLVWALLISVIAMAISGLLLMIGVLLTVIRKLLATLLLSSVMQKSLPEWLKYWVWKDTEPESE